MFTTKLPLQHEKVRVFELNLNASANLKVLLFTAHDVDPGH